MGVSAAHRRHGIGERMLAQTSRWFGSRGVRRMELSVAAGNAIGNAFWRKHGFRDHMHRLVREDRRP
jgi:ribosomal protein S18 acetylase RimI-like enzyme